MLDWLVLWGVTQAVGFVFKPVLEDLAKDAAKDWVGDIFKDSLKNVLRLPHKKPLEIAAGKALKEFLQLVQQQLQIAGLEQKAVQEYVKPFKQFVKAKPVIGELGRAFQENCKVLDTKVLAETWNSLNLPSLPKTFNWEIVTQLYLIQVQAIRQESPELRQILDSQAQVETGKGVQELVGIPVDFDLAKYQESLQEYYGNLKLESLDITGGYYELKLWKMFIPQNVRKCHEFLPQVYELPKETQQRLKEEGQLEEELSPEELEWYRKSYAEQPIHSVLEAVEDKDYNYLVILGDPGSGKSTLLQYLALNWAEKPLNELPLHPLPLLIELRIYIRNRESGDCKNFLEYIHSGSSSICHLNQLHLHEWLRDGKAVVMFDGLDEIFDPEKRDDVITSIIRFSNNYPKVRVIVTSRVIGYKAQRLRDATFQHFMLQELDKKQIEEFIQRWHELIYSDEAEKIRKRERLQKAITDSKAIRELAGNPLLLTMMAILNRNQELPRDRAELYNQASRVLLHQWDVERKFLEDPRIDSITIDYKDKQAMLRQVAYHILANERGLVGNSIHTDELEKILADYLKTIEVKDHRTAGRIMIDQLRTRNFILCYLGADYYAFIHRTFLEYFCAWEFVWRFEKEQKISFEDLKTKIFGKHWKDESWHEVLRLIAGMIDAKFVGEIIEYLMKQDGKQEKFNNLLLAAACLLEVRTRSEILSIATKLLDSLKSRVQPSDDWIVRRAVITMIAKGWKDAPDTLHWLKERVQSDVNLAVRQAAVEEIAKTWQQELGTFPWLKTLVQFDESMYLRQAAAQELVKGWRNKPETFEFFYNLVNSSFDDKRKWVGTPRQTALKVIIEYYPDNPQTSELLRNCAEYDPDEKIREFAKEALLSKSGDLILKADNSKLK